MKEILGYQMLELNERVLVEDVKSFYKIVDR
jgi:hypothetical protein